MSWKAIAREPLVHFLVIGIMLFSFDAWRGTSERAASPPAPAPPVAPAAAASPTPTGPIVVDAEVVARVRVQAERRLGRAPTAAELDAEVTRWVDEEVLVREAIARGLERDDPVIHKRIADRMTFVLEQSLIVTEPTDAELRAWFDAHRDQWAQPERIDFTQVSVKGFKQHPTTLLYNFEDVWFDKA